MYTLTLTKTEREAFDWVGDRYATGNDVADLLCECLPEDKDWDSEVDVEFKIPGNIVYQIWELSDEENDLWPCFSDELRDKMNAFLDRALT